MEAGTYKTVNDIIREEVQRFRGWHAREADLDFAARIFEEGLATMAARLEKFGAVDWQGRSATA